jgi:Uma2 family endonuclease
MHLELDEPRRKFTVSDVTRMIRAGILGEDDRVELLDGELYSMGPHDPDHAGPIGRLQRRLHAVYGDGYVIRTQLPLEGSATDLPEPDLAVVRGTEAEYDRRHPLGSDAVLVVEVSWSTQRRDRQKAILYARAGVPVYWRLDVEQRQLEVYQRPGPDGAYGDVGAVDESGEVVVPGTGTRWRVADLLPARRL